MITALLLSAALAQDQPDQHEHDKPQNALEELKEIRKLMQTAEGALQGASLGKAAAEQEEILKMLGQLDKNPAELQKKVLEMIDKLLRKSEKDQKDTIERLTELIKKSKQGG